MIKLKKIKVNGVDLTLIEFSIFIGVSRQQIYNYMKNYNVDQIIKYKKRNDLTIRDAIEKARKSYTKETKEKVIENSLKKEQEYIDKINYLERKIKSTINLINGLIRNYYKGDYCLQDLENIKKELS